jgi:peroxiredoxin
MKKLYYLLALLAIASCKNSTNEYVINGITSNIIDNTLVYLEKDQTIIDSALIKNNTFHFKGNMEENFAQMVLRTKDFKEYKVLWVVNSEMTFDASKSSFQNGKIIGSNIQNQDDEWDRSVEIWDEKGDSLRTIIKKIKESDSLKNALKKLQKQFRDKETKEGIAYIKKHPDYQLSSYYLSFLKFTLSKKETEELYDNLNKDVKSNRWGKTTSFFLEHSVNLEVGDTAIDFSLPDHNGNNISLSSFKGKYVLLEFWAQWCGPCRIENPNLLKGYRKFNKNGFEIFGVSLDKNKESWLQVIKKDSIIWTTVSDLKGQDSEPVLMYKANYLPKNYLIDPKGIIIAKDLRGKKLQSKLEQLFVD